MTNSIVIPPALSGDVAQRTLDWRHLGWVHHYRLASMPLARLQRSAVTIRPLPRQRAAGSFLTRRLDANGIIGTGPDFPLTTVTPDQSLRSSNVKKWTG